MNRLYLDYNATSPLSPSVLNWLKSGDFCFGNPASQHSSGKASRKIINQSRAFIYQVFNKNEKDSKLFFHSGATEAFLTMAFSFSEKARKSGKNLLICSSKIDHPAVTSLNKKYFGSHVDFFELERDENLSYLHQKNFHTIVDKKQNDSKLMVLYHHLWVHNETGLVSALNELEIFKSIEDLYLHVDAVQAPGKIPDWQNLGTGDIWSFSAHKFGALSGIGFSFFRIDLPFEPLISGGGQQAGLRAGTESTMGVKSIALALSDLLEVNVLETAGLRKELENFLKSALAGLGELLVDSDANRCSNTIYFYFYDHPSDLTLAMFDIEGIEVSAGSACSSGAARPSEIMLQKGLVKMAKNGIRLSHSLRASEVEVEELKNKFTQVLTKLRTMSI